MYTRMCDGCLCDWRWLWAATSRKCHGDGPISLLEPPLNQPCSTTLLVRCGGMQQGTCFVVYAAAAVLLNNMKYRESKSRHAATAKRPSCSRPSHLVFGRVHFCFVCVCAIVRFVCCSPFANLLAPRAAAILASATGRHTYPAPMEIEMCV